VTLFKDRMIVWILEYIFGGTLVLVPLTNLVFRHSIWTDVYIWTVNLFVASLGVILISCASSMRQRMHLAKRIDKLAEQIKANHAFSQISAEADGQTGRSQ